MNRFKKTFRPEVETLESREVMNATFSLSGGVLTITSDGVGDVLNVRQTNNSITINGRLANPNTAVTQVVVHGNGGNDIIDLRNVRVPAVVYGGSGHDRIIGGLNADYLDGGVNNDIILGLGGNDSLRGGSGNDRLFGNGDYDYLYGEDGTDFLDDGNRAAQETMFGGDGADFSADTWTINGATTGDIVQGQSLACTFLASLGAGADSGINYANWIRYVGYDSNYMPFYQVRFLHQGQWHYENVRFDGTVYQSDTATAVNRPDRVAEYESWVLLMHRAFVQAYGNLGSSSNTYTLHNATGGPVQAKYYGSFDYNAKVVLVNATNANKPVVTGVEDANLFGATNHAFTVVGARGNFDTSLEILVYNPWGKDGQGYGFQPRDGRDDGFIWLTWSEFTSVMEGFWVRQ